MARNELLYLVPIVNTVGGGFFGLILWKAKASNGISVVRKKILSHLIKDDDQRTEFAFWLIMLFSTFVTFEFALEGNKKLTWTCVNSTPYYYTKTWA